MTTSEKTFTDEGPKIAAAMRRVWKLQDRPDPFAGEAGEVDGWEAFGLMVAAALESPEPVNEAAVRAVEFVNSRRAAALRDNR